MRLAPKGDDGVAGRKMILSPELPTVFCVFIFYNVILLIW